MKEILFRFRIQLISFLVRYALCFPLFQEGTSGLKGLPNVRFNPSQSVYQEVVISTQPIRK